jgi:hypothetical protein
VIGSVTELSEYIQPGKGRVHWQPGQTQAEIIGYVEGVGDPEEPEDTADPESGPCLLAISFVDEFFAGDPEFEI